MTGIIYILRTKNNKYYIGSTNNFERRIQEHKSAKTKYLQNLLPITLAFSQKFDNIYIAREIEFKLKRFKNRRIIEKIIKEGKITAGL